MIKCKLQLMEKSKFVTNNPPYKKFGRYALSSFHSIKGFGSTCWVVVVNILVDYDQYIEKGMTPEDVALQCVEYLNHRPKSKYGKKRKRKPLYGTFKPEPHLIKFFNKDGEKYIQALLITEDRTNPNIWGEGDKEEYYSCRRKRRK